MPVQVMVLKELPGPEEAYMFAAFLTGKEKLRLNATALLIKKHLEDPSNSYRRELLEFKFKNQLLIPEEIGMVMEMLKQVTEKDRERIEDILRNHPASREMAERIRNEGRAEVISKYLDRKYGQKAADLHQNIYKISDLETLDYLLEELFAANTLEEARVVINDRLEKLNQ